MATAAGRLCPRLAATAPKACMLIDGGWTGGVGYAGGGEVAAASWMAMA